MRPDASVANLCVLAVVLLAAFVAGPLPAQAGAIDTEHPFGFTFGTDAGNVGKKEIKGWVDHGAILEERGIAIKCACCSN